MKSRMLATAAVVTLLATAGVGSVRAQDNTAEGAREFRARCGSCHSTEAGENRAGPHLADVFGRAAGAVEGACYSAAMSRSGLVWDKQTLDEYIANPRRTVPGTSMPVGLTDDRRRALVIEYLRGLSDDPA